MDKLEDEPTPDQMQCPYCHSQSKALLGVLEGRQLRRVKCRKCDKEYWENTATGLVQIDGSKV